MKHTKRLVALGAVVALVALACGDGARSDNPASDGLSPATTVPPADVVQDDPAPDVASTCLEDEPDCQDIPGAGSEPLPLDDEPKGVEPGGGAGLVIGGGLTVAEALETDATGVIAVQGFVVRDSSGIRLCDLLAESLPPQCGGAVDRGLRPQHGRPG